MDKRPKWVLIAVVISFSILAVILGMGLQKLIQYRASAVPLYPSSGYPQVTIISPLQNSQFSLGDPIIVQVTAYGNQEINSVELYVNSKLVGTDSAPPGGSYSYLAEFLWSPPIEGVYVLIAQVDGFELLTAFSSPIHVEITDPEYDLEAGDTVDYPAIINMDLLLDDNLPVPDAPPVPAEDWKGSPGNWINSLTADIPPKAPELAASIQGCSVTLSIHDLSDNEEGFEVWRVLPNSPTWARIAVLASQSKDDWITYTDNNAHGQTSYFVSAFNKMGIQNSNLVSVNPDPANCAPPVESRSVLTLKLESLEHIIPVDRFYCYLSLDGDHWMRKPEFGFWPDAGLNQDGGSVEIELMSLNLTGDDKNEPDVQPLTFYLDCWGWQGGSLVYLGNFSQTLNPDQEDKVEVSSDGLSAVAAITKGIGGLPEFYPMGGNGNNNYGLAASDDAMQIHQIPPWFQKSTIDPEMPIPIPYITYDPNLCKSHLPPPFQNEFGQFLFCTPFPGFDLGDEGVNPQPYFVWKMSNKCLNGSGDPFCKPYIYWLSLAADVGGEVGFKIYDSNPEGFHIYDVNAPEHFSLVIPPVPCSGTRLLWVQMWYYDGSSLLPTYGPPSAKYIVDCTEKIKTTMVLELLFDAILLSNVDDGESAPQDVEVYGYIKASTESQNWYLNFAPWNEQASGCPDESFGNLGTSGGMSCPKLFNDGIYDLADVALSLADSYDPWYEDYKFDNNTLLLSIEEYDSLTLSVKLVDWDDGSANDLVCQGNFQIQSQSIFDWYKVKDQKFGITGSLTDSGYCQIKGMMNAQGP